jgi:asparagine synthase (glutamine-hydrolysing)
MLDLCAITGDLKIISPSNTRKHSKECRRSDVYMRVEGDVPVDSFLYADPDVTLICRADLLDPASQSTMNVASHLCGLYREQGDGFVNTLSGTFAIILYDHRHRTLKAWTDHFGAERLVYGECDESLLVATDIRSILAATGRKRISPSAIQEYLLYTCIPTPRTIYEGISKIPPGHQLVSRPTITTRSYWDIRYTEDDPQRSESAWANWTRDAVRSAVANGLNNLSASRTGCFLSGGTDSSSVTGFVKSLTGEPPHTFSIGFDDPRYNEIRYARIAARHFSTNYHEYFVTPQDILDVVERAAKAYDEPFGNSSIVPTYHCARLAAEHGMTHLLAGDGGDELFGGNDRYAHDRIFQQYRRIPLPLRRFIIERAALPAAQWTGLRIAKLGSNYVRRCNVPLPDRYFSYSIVCSMPGQDLFESDFATTLQGHNPLAPARAHFNDAPAQDELNRWLYLDLKITIADNDLRKVMTMSKLAGVTPRFPFLNPTLAEFTARIPPDLKVRGRRLRYIFKKAMQEILPDPIIKKTKHGFGLPYSVWLADSKRLRDFTFDVLGSARCRERGYFRSGLFDWLWSQYQSVHRGYYGDILWLLLMLELWHVNHSDVDLAQDRSPNSCEAAVWTADNVNPPLPASQLN